MTPGARGRNAGHIPSTFALDWRPRRTHSSLERALSSSQLTPGQRLASLIAVIASLLVAAMTVGFNAPLFAARLKELGFDETMIGLSAAAGAVGLLVLAPVAPGLIGRHGVARVMVASAASVVLAYLACAAFPGLLSWTLVRLPMGVVVGTLWIAGEVWVTETATDATRGRVLAIYTAAFGLGTAAGPVFLSEVGHDGDLPFVIAAVITLVSMLPVILARRLAPAVADEASGFSFRTLLVPLRGAPVPMMLSLSFALVFAELWTFLPVYAIDTGLDVARALDQLAAFSIGSIVLQYPIGWLADRIDRRLVAVLVMTAILGLVAVMGPLDHARGLDFVYFFVLGGVVTGSYVVALLLLGERFHGAGLAAAMTVSMLMWSLGSFVGPPLVGAATLVVGPGGLPLMLVLSTAVFIPFVVASWWRGRRGGA